MMVFACERGAVGAREDQPDAGTSMGRALGLAVRPSYHGAGAERKGPESKTLSGPK